MVDIRTDIDMKQEAVKIDVWRRDKQELSKFCSNGDTIKLNINCKFITEGTKIKHRIPIIIHIGKFTKIDRFKVKP